MHRCSRNNEHSAEQGARSGREQAMRCERNDRAWWGHLESDGIFGVIVDYLGKDYPGIFQN